MNDGDTYTHPTLQADPESELEFVSTTATSIEYAPKEDVTAHELALCMPVLLAMIQSGPTAVKNHIEGLPDKAARHFEVDA